MGSQAEHWTNIYARTHEQRLAESIERARQELVTKYGAAETYAKYQKELLAMSEEELTKAQKALLEYDQSRGGKQGSIDDTAKLLGVMADAGNTIARETGESKQRQLDAEASVVSRYNLTNAQSTAIGGVNDFLRTQTDMSVFKSAADIDRNVDAILSKIPDGTFVPGTDASKTGMSELYSFIDSTLSKSPVYASDPNAKASLRKKLATRLGVNESYADKGTVEDDKDLAIFDAKKLVGQTGTDTSSQAASIARDLISGKLERMSKEQRVTFNDFQEEYGGKYFDLLKEGATIGEAKALITEGFDATKKAEFEKLFEDTRVALAEGGDQDIQKFFDPAYVNTLSRTVKLGMQTEQAKKDFASAVEALKTPPTEEEARRRGVEIYEPISPGVGKRTKEAGVRLEERAATSRMTGMPMSDDDLMASRMLKKSPQLPDEERILAAASLAAVRELNKGWKPGQGNAGKGSDFRGNMTPEEYEILGSPGQGPAVEMGYRLFSNIKEKQLRDLSPKSIVKYASDLAGGDAGLRDAVLQEFYKHAGNEMKGVEVQKAATDVEKVEKQPKQLDIDIDMEF